MWTKNFTLITVINLFVSLGFFMQISTLPVYIQQMGSGESMVGVVIGLFTVTAVLMRPFSGFLTDKFGRRIMIIIAFIVMSISTIGYYLVPAVAQILLLRLLHGAGWGISSTATSTTATDNLPKNHLGEGMGYYMLATSLAMAISPAIGLWFAANGRFDLFFWSSTGMLIFALILAQFISYYKPDEKARAGKLSLSSMFEKSAIRPAVICFFISISNSGVTSFIPLYAATRGIANIGTFFTVYAIVMLLCRPLAGRLLDRKGPRIVLIPCLSLAVVSMVIMTYATTLPMFYIVAVTYGMGFGCALPSLLSLAVMHAPKERLGAANSTYNMSMDVGVGIGALILGTLAESHGYSVMYLSSAGMCLVALVLFVVLFGKRDPKTET